MDIIIWRVIIFVQNVANQKYNWSRRAGIVRVDSIIRAIFVQNVANQKYNQSQKAGIVHVDIIIRRVIIFARYVEKEEIKK